MFFSFVEDPGGYHSIEVSFAQLLMHLSEHHKKIALPSRLFGILVVELRLKIEGEEFLNYLPQTTKFFSSWRVYNDGSRFIFNW